MRTFLSARESLGVAQETVPCLGPAAPAVVGGRKREAFLGKIFI